MLSGVWLRLNHVVGGLPNWKATPQELNAAIHSKQYVQGTSIVLKEEESGRTHEMRRDGRVVTAW